MLVMMYKVIYFTPSERLVEAKSSDRNFHKGLKETPIARLRLQLIWATVIELLISASLHTFSF